MDTSFEQKVRERAYHIWKAAGMDDGQAHDHWAQAEAAVANETGAPVKKAAAPKKPAAAKKATVAKKPAPKATAKTSKAKH